MKNIKVNLEYSKINDMDEYKEMIKEKHELLHNKTGLGNDFLGWLDLPINYDKEEFERIKKAANKIQNDSDILVVIGIGGSYLGARAIIDCLSHNFKNDLENNKVPKILFAGNNISSKYLSDLIDVLEGKNVSLNVISKSGTTTEPAIAFRILKEYMEKRYGDTARERIYVTTDRAKGALKELSNSKEYETFVVPDDVGGRYSVLTAVGLLPIAVAGINIDELMQGANDARIEYNNPNLDENECYKYAVARNILYSKEKFTEILVSYEPNLMYFIEWWKQLYGESEGKDGKGIFPAGDIFTTDLHSMGQYIQEGRRSFFETVIRFNDPLVDITLKQEDNDLDGLNYLAGKTMDFVNKKAMEGTINAHFDGDVSNIVIEVEKQDCFNIGKLIYFFEKACAISGYILGVNPFNQPGVEKYKKNMFKLLNKPGY